MTDYYVDATGGDDAKDGLSEANAWKTIAKVNGSSFSAGDNIYFKRGEVWRETLQPPSSGSSGNPITFGAYGTGAKPRITGSDLQGSFSQVAGSATLVDSMEVHSFNFFNFGRDSQNYWRVSEWTATETFTCPQVKAWMAQVGTISSGNVWIEIYDDDGGTPGSLITNGTSDTIAGSSVSTSGELLTFEFSTPPTLTDTNTYYFVAKFDWTLSTSNYMQWRGLNSDSDADFNHWRIQQGGTEDDLSVDGGHIEIFKEGASNQWEATVTTDPRVVYFVTDGEYGEEQSSTANVNAAYEWHWTANTLTVYATSDPSNDVEVGARNHACNPDNVSYVDFEDIQFDTALQHTVFLEASSNASNLNFTDVDILRGFEFNFLQQSTHVITDCTLTRVASSYAGAVGIQLNGATAGARTGWTLQDCTSTYDSYVHSDFDRGSGNLTFGGGIKIVDSDTAGRIEDITVDGCTVTYAGYKDDNTTEVESSNKGFGIWVDLVNASENNEIVVSNCVSSNNRQAGFFCEKTNWSIWHHNVAVSNGGPGLFVGQRYDSNPPDSSNNKFYHFTLYGNNTESLGFDSGNLHVAGGFSASGMQLENNQFRNILCANSQGTYEASFEFGGENDGTNGDNNTYEYLCFGTEATAFVEWVNGTDLDTYSAWDTQYQASTGVDIDQLHYVNDDPTFVDAPTNLHLAPGSAGIDDGVAITGYNDGYSGSAPDIGFSEFVPSVSSRVSSLASIPSLPSV